MSQEQATPVTVPLRVGVIGAGRMAVNHIRALARTAGRAELVGVADPSPAARESLQVEFPGLRAYPSLGELLAAERPDVVHIVTPPATHLALAREALMAGVHIYLEKPFTETCDEASELLRLAAEGGLQVCAGHQLLFEPPTRAIERLLPALGPIVHVESYFSFRTVRHMPGGRAPLRPDLQLLDILPHPVYLLLRILERAGEGPTELTALEVSHDGTVHALVRKGAVTGTLVVTLEGRPVESYLRVIGRNGSLFGDYVRSTVQRSIGPGTGGVDKLIAPYRQAWQVFWGTTAALGRRFLSRQRSYPGLAELFAAFYDAVGGRGPAPLTPESIAETVRICEEVAEVLRKSQTAAETQSAPRPMDGRGVLVTGGTGFLGRNLVRSLLARGRAVRVVGRRKPPAWERIPEAEYVVGDLAVEVPAAWFSGVDTVVHCAAETAGKWEEHRRNSLEATERMVRGAAGAGVGHFLQVSSLAVLAAGRGRPIGDDHPLEPDSRGSGPYVWGKLESERMAVQLGRDLGVAVKVVRPGALVDYQDFDPPGRLGKRLGNIFVAVGSPRHRLGTTEVHFAADVMAWMADHWAEAPEVLNLLDPESPTKRELLNRLKLSNPDLTVIWLPTVVLVPLSWLATLLQKALRPSQPAINLAKVFSAPAYDTAGVRRVATGMAASTLHGTTAASGSG